jgi:hypothetical protein
LKRSAITLLAGFDYLSVNKLVRHCRHDLWTYFGLNFFQKETTDYAA